MLFPNLTNSAGDDLDQVQLTGMLMSCVIGIFPNERNRKQPVSIDLCLYLNTRKAAATTNIHDTIDYAAAVKEISFILEQCEFQLIESAVDTVCRYFLMTYSSENALPQVDAVVVRISKPSALTHGIVPAIQIQRHRDEIQNSSATAVIRSIHDSPSTKLMLHKLMPGKELTLSKQPGHYRALLTIGRIHHQGEAVKPRTTFVAEALADKQLIMTNETSTDQLTLVLV